MSASAAFCRTSCYIFRKDNSVRCHFMQEVASCADFSRHGGHLRFGLTLGAIEGGYLKNTPHRTNTGMQFWPLGHAPLQATRAGRISVQRVQRVTGVLSCSHGGRTKDIFSLAFYWGPCWTYTIGCVSKRGRLLQMNPQCTVPPSPQAHRRGRLGTNSQCHGAQLLVKAALTRVPPENNPVICGQLGGATTLQVATPMFCLMRPVLGQKKISWLACPLPTL